MIKKLSQFTNVHTISLTVILLIGIFFRFFNTPLRYTLGPDQIRDAMVALGGVKLMQLPLIGPFSSLGPFTFGPWYYYHLIIFSFITRLTYAPWICMGIISVLFIFVMYKVGQYLENERFGLILAFFAAISPAQIQVGIDLSNPYLVGIYAALTLYLFLKLLQKKVYLISAFFFGLCLGIGINNHYQMAGLSLFLLIYIVVKRTYWKEIIVSIGGLLISFLPLLYFNILTNWHTLRGMYFYVTVGRNAIYVPNRWLTYLKDFWPEFFADTLGVPKIVATGIILLALGIFIYFLIKRKIKKETLYIIGVFFMNFIFLRYYSGPRFFGYLQYLHPFIFIFCGYLFFLFLNQKRKLIVFLGLILLVILTSIILPKSAQKLVVYQYNRDINSLVEKISDKYPQINVEIYSCKNIDTVGPVSVAYFLSQEYTFRDAKTQKVLFDNVKCMYPNTKGYTFSSTPSATLVNKIYPPLFSLSMRDVSSASEAALEKNGWKKLTPESYYDTTVRWWIPTRSME